MRDYSKNLAGRSCIICGGSDYLRLSTSMKKGPQLTTVICKSCSLVFTNPVPSQEIYYSFYTSDYERYYGKTTAKRPLLLNEPPIFSTLEKLKLIDLKSSDYLEIGPGRGISLYHANRIFKSTLGVEPSIDFTNLLVNEFQLNIINTTFEDFISTYKEQVNVVAMFHVLEHMYDPYGCLMKIRSILREDGLLIIEVPNILKPFKSLDSYFLRFVHLFNFSLTTLRLLLSKCGFDIVYVNEGIDDWASPQHLTIIAKRSKSINSLVIDSSAEASKVIEILNQYRHTFRKDLRYKWLAHQSKRLIMKIRKKISHKTKQFSKSIFRTSSFRIN